MHSLKNKIKRAAVSQARKTAAGGTNHKQYIGQFAQGQAKNYHTIIDKLNFELAAMKISLGVPNLRGIERQTIQRLYQLTLRKLQAVA